MNEAILKLAEEIGCGSYPKSNGVFQPPRNIEAFYRAAYNKAIKDAADMTNEWREVSLTSAGLGGTDGNG